MPRCAGECPAVPRGAKGCQGCPRGVSERAGRSHTLGLPLMHYNDREHQQDKDGGRESFWDAHGVESKAKQVLDRIIVAVAGFSPHPPRTAWLWTDMTPLLKIRR